MFRHMVSAFFDLSLPPAYEVRGKVMFSVCPPMRGGGTPDSGPKSFPGRAGKGEGCGDG